MARSRSSSSATAAWLSPAATAARIAESRRSFEARMRSRAAAAASRCSRRESSAVASVDCARIADSSVRVVTYVMYEKGLCTRH